MLNHYIESLKSKGDQPTNKKSKNLNYLDDQTQEITGKK